MDERRAVERHLVAVGRVAAFVAHALVLVEDRYTLHAVAARFGHARVRTVGHVRPGQRPADHLQRSLVDNHLWTITIIDGHRRSGRERGR